MKNALEGQGAQGKPIGNCCDNSGDDNGRNELRQIVERGEVGGIRK